MSLVEILADNKISVMLSCASAPEGNQMVSTFVAAAAGAAVAPSEAAYSGPTAASKIDGSSRHTVKEAGGVIAHWTVSRRL